MPLRDWEHRDVRLQLPRPSVITGRIVDEHGNPATGASLRALQFSMAFGYRRAMSVGMATTDSQGIFRIESLTPGDYVVCASTHQTAPLNSTPSASRWKSIANGETLRCPPVRGSGAEGARAASQGT